MKPNRLVYDTIPGMDHTITKRPADWCDCCEPGNKAIFEGKYEVLYCWRGLLRKTERKLKKSYNNFKYGKKRELTEAFKRCFGSIVGLTLFVSFMLWFLLMPPATLESLVAVITISFQPVLFLCILHFMVEVWWIF